MHYITNFIKDEQKGNSIFTGETLHVEVTEAIIVSGGIYKDNFPIQIDQDKNKLDFKLLERYKSFFGKHRYRGLETGKYLLKVRAYDTQMRGQGWNDEFEIL